MGLFSRMRKRRNERKAVVKAAKVRAKADAKAEAKLQRDREDFLRRTAKKVRKQNQKDLKARRKHEEKLAEATVQQLKAGRFNARNVLRYAGAARVAAPLAIPLIYRAMTQLQAASNNTQSQGVTGSTSSPVARAQAWAQSRAAMPQAAQNLPTDGAPQRARISGIRRSVKTGVPSGFAKDVAERMDILDDAVASAQGMGPEKAARMLESVSNELDLVEAQIATKK